MMLRFKEGTTRYWYAVQPENHRNKITGAFVILDNTKLPLAFGTIDGFWFQGGELPNDQEITFGFEREDEENEEGHSVCATVAVQFPQNGPPDGMIDGLVMQGEC